MSQFRARAQQLIKSDDGTNARFLSYLCHQHSIRECFKEGFFNSVSHNLLPGDQIRVIQITRKRIPEDEVVSAAWTGIVLKVTKKARAEKVVFVPVDGNGPQEYKIPEEESKEEKEKFEPVEYIQDSDGQVEHNKRSGTWTVKCKGKEVATVDTKKEAQEIVRGDVPIPKPAIL